MLVKAKALPPFESVSDLYGLTPKKANYVGPSKLTFTMGTTEALPPALSVNGTVTDGNSPGGLKPSSFYTMGWGKLSHSHGC